MCVCGGGGAGEGKGDVSLVQGPTSHFTQGGSEEGCSNC